MGGIMRGRFGFGGLRVEALPAGGLGMRRGGRLRDGVLRLVCKTIRACYMSVAFGGAAICLLATLVRFMEWATGNVDASP